MAMRTEPSGKILYSPHDPITSFDLIVKGSVTVCYPNGEFILEKGDILGIMDVCSEIHRFRYTANSDITLLTYPYTGADSLLPLLKATKDLSVLLSSSMTKQVCQLIDHFVFVQFESDNLYHFISDSYNDYKDFCTKYVFPIKTLPKFEQMLPIDTENVLPPFITEYYENIRELSLEDFRLLFQKNLGFASGYLLKAGSDVTSCLLLCEEYGDYNSEMSYFLLNEDSLDFFDLYTEVYCKTIANGFSDSSLMAIISKLMIYIEGIPSIDSTFYTLRTSHYQTLVKQAELLLSSQQKEVQAHMERAQEVTDSLEIILNYADCPLNITEAFRSAVHRYRAITDKSSPDDTLAALHRQLTSLFYEIYTAAFFKSLTGVPVPIVVKMFFEFGYVDEIVAGIDNSLFLYHCIKTLKGCPIKGIYTVYEWFSAIYRGEKEPCRNEFDADYTSYVHDLKVSGKITASQEVSLLADTKEKLRFELQNVFPCVNKIVFGRITNYSPVLSEHNILKSLDNVIVSSNKILETIDALRSIDYTAFYRETVYSNPEYDIAKEYVQIEIQPDIILFPTLGTRGSMWQEIEGKRRNTPSRFMLPILSLTDISLTLTRLTAEYRWEMCKRVQGSRWNDITEPSLTADYVDYIQFYRKNHALSVDAKEKIKLSLSRFRNSFKECFVQDYLDFIQYESKGSPRLNKAARNILFSYCPFTAPIREHLQSNPLYHDCLHRHNIKQGQNLHRFELLRKKLTASGHDIPLEISLQEHYFKS